MVTKINKGKVWFLLLYVTEAMKSVAGLNQFIFVIFNILNPCEGDFMMGFYISVLELFIVLTLFTSSKSSSSVLERFRDK